MIIVSEIGRPSCERSCESAISVISRMNGRNKAIEFMARTFT